VIKTDLSRVFLAICLGGDLAERLGSRRLLDGCGDGDLCLRTAGLCLRLGEGERRRRGDVDWLLRR